MGKEQNVMRMVQNKTSEIAMHCMDGRSVCR